MAFTYAIGTDRGAVRLAIGDTQEAIGIFSDAEVDHFLAVGGSVAGATEYGLRMLMAHHATRGDAARVAAIRERLAMTGGDMPTADVIYPSALPMDQGFTEPTTT